MSHESEQNFSEIQTRLAALLPTEPRRTAADAAYEAGRRDGQQAARSRLVLHRFATAAALVVAVSAGMLALTANRTEAPAPTSLASQPEPPQEPREAIPSPPRPLPEPSPHSYLSLRVAVMSDGGINLDRLPESPPAGPEGMPPAPTAIPRARSLGL